MHNFITLGPVTKGVLGVLSIVLLGAGTWYLATTSPAVTPGPDGGGVFCTADAMQCPDGSWVGRTGPNCEFVCPAATTTLPVGGGGNSGGGAVACTMEAKQCPDGSYVGRTGPNCEFSACPGAGFAEYKSGITGTVMAGPTCPVERNPPDPQCADRPIATNVSVVYKSNPGRTVAVTSSAADGTFKLSLPPGEYIVQSGSYGTPFPRCADAAATVGPSGYTTVVISCDTGIR